MAWTPALLAAEARSVGVTGEPPRHERRILQQQPQSTQPGICQNTCAYPEDGICDDGGPAYTYADCTYGHDCTDCGVRPYYPASPPTPPPVPSSPPEPPPSPLSQRALESVNIVEAEIDRLCFAQCARRSSRPASVCLSIARGRCGSQPSSRSRCRYASYDAWRAPLPMARSAARTAASACGALLPAARRSPPSASPGPPAGSSWWRRWRAASRRRHSSRSTWTWTCTCT